MMSVALCVAVSGIVLTSDLSLQMLSQTLERQTDGQFHVRSTLLSPLLHPPLPLHKSTNELSAELRQDIRNVP